MDIVKQNNDIVQLVNSNEFADFEQLTDDTPQGMEGAENTALANTQANTLQRKEHHVTGGTNSLSINKNINVKTGYYGGLDRTVGVFENLSSGGGAFVGESGKALNNAVLLGHKLTETANLFIKLLMKVTSITHWTPSEITKHNKLMAERGAAIAWGYFLCGLSLLMVVCIFIFVHSLIKGQ